MATEADARGSVSEAGADAKIAVIDTAGLEAVEYEWGAIKWICDLTVTPESLQSFGYAYVLPGTMNPEHRHKTCEEIVYMLAGELTVIAGDDRTTVRPGQTALIPRGIHHSVVNEGWEPVVYIASFSAVVRETEFDGDTGELHTEFHGETGEVHRVRHLR